MKENEEFREEVLTWFEKHNPKLLENYKSNLDFTDGHLQVNNKNGIDFLDQELLIRIIDQRPWEQKG
jgi:hypothetical protein